MENKLREIIASAFNEKEIVFEENKEFLIVYNYIEPFIAKGVMDDTKGDLLPLFRIDKERKEIIGLNEKEYELKRKIKELL